MNIQWQNEKELTRHSARRCGGERNNPRLGVTSPRLGVASRYVGLKAKLRICNNKKTEQNGIDVNMECRNRNEFIGKSRDLLLIRRKRSFRRAGIAVAGEELFHAYQTENKNKYGGTSNAEFEARVFTTAAYSELRLPAPDYKGMKSFQSEIINGNYGDIFIPLTPTNVKSSKFVNDYIRAANIYAKFNITHNIGNDFYKENTIVPPYSLQQIVKKAYESK